ncbi:DUF3710 domain-containing protein [Streptomyces griseorubiginosus]|uniref:DUF3710 domain-containing protein n=1 Tax=Streptomyces griseorubiginosus TaxID=67304 RepID=UPI0033B0C443
MSEAGAGASSDAVAGAREIVEQYRRDGELSAGSIDRAGFGVRDRVTPGALLVVAAVLIDAENPTLAEASPRPGVRILAAMLREGLDGLALAQRDGGFRWDDLVALIQAYLSLPGTSPGALDTLLDEAESVWTEIVHSGEVTRPRGRDGESGPWDVAEAVTDVARLDYGVLRVPRLEGVSLHPLTAGERVVGVVVSLGDQALGLQVFRTPAGPAWDTVRPKIAQGVRDQGGSAEEAVGTLGSEVRAQVPVVRDGERVLQPTRIFACDGPGWLLRGTHGGPSVPAEAVDPRVQHLFTQTVVDLSSAEDSTGPAQEVTEVEIRWPARNDLPERA